MTTSYYAQLLSYAGRHLPLRCVLEAGDLVNEAYLRVGATDRVLLLKTIRTLGLKLRGQSAFVPFYESKRKLSDRKSFRETSRLCPTCNIEKSMNDFRLMRYKNLPAIYRLNQCTECTSRSDWQRRKLRYAADPKLHARYKQQCRKAQTKYYKTISAEEREKRRLRCKAYRAMIKADPAAYAAYLEKSRTQSARYHAQVQTDPAKRDARNQRHRAWRKAKKAAPT